MQLSLAARVSETTFDGTLICDISLEPLAADDLLAKCIRSNRIENPTISKIRTVGSLYRGSIMRKLNLSNMRRVIEYCPSPMELRISRKTIESMKPSSVAFNNFGLLKFFQWFQWPH